MAEQRQPFRFRIPWLPGASAPALTQAEPTQRPVVEPLAAAERVPFQPIARPPFRPAGIAQVPSPPPPGKAPSPPRKAPQFPSPPRAAPESSLSLRPTTQPEEVIRPSVLKIADEKPVKSIDSASVPKFVMANHQEPTPLVPQVVPPASQASSSSSPISRPTGESQGPFRGIFSKLQEDKGVEATDKAEAPMEAAGSVASTGKAKEKESTHPMPPVPKKQPEGPLPLASSSHEQKKKKFIPKKRVAMTSFHHSTTNQLESHLRLGAVRGSSPSLSSLQKEIKDDMSKFVHSITSGKANTSIIQESVDTITLAGENTGATMHLTSGLAEREEHIHIRRNDRSNPDESIEGTTDVEEGEWEVDGSEEDEESDNSAFLNSNVQGVNNSLVLDSSVSEGSPGVHLELALNAEPQLISRSEAFKDEFGITPSEKHTYEPTIRRTCLRGIFMDSSDDSSDDDKDNPTKPRRHG